MNRFFLCLVEINFYFITFYLQQTIPVFNCFRTSRLQAILPVLRTALKTKRFSPGDIQSPSPMFITLRVIQKRRDALLGHFTPPPPFILLNLKWLSIIIIKKVSGHKTRKTFEISINFFQRCAHQYYNYIKNLCNYIFFKNYLVIKNLF